MTAHDGGRLRGGGKVGLRGVARTERAANRDISERTASHLLRGRQAHRSAGLNRLNDAKRTVRSRTDRSTNGATTGRGRRRDGAKRLARRGANRQLARFGRLERLCRTTRLRLTAGRRHSHATTVIKRTTRRRESVRRRSASKNARIRPIQRANRSRARTCASKGARRCQSVVVISKCGVVVI